MLIEKQGDPKKTFVDPVQFDYRFQCDDCGCVFVENGSECEIKLFYFENDVADVSVTPACPNCKRWVYGIKK